MSFIRAITMLFGARSTSARRWSRPSTRVKQIVAGVCEETGSDIVEMEIMPDHVHLLVGRDPQFGIHRLVKAIKGRSSRLLRDEFLGLKSRLPSLWTNSYFVCTVGGAPLAVIKQYVENQKGF